jgi:hypothetical protein
MLLGAGMNSNDTWEIEIIRKAMREVFPSQIYETLKARPTAVIWTDDEAEQRELHVDDHLSKTGAIWIPKAGRRF